MKFRVMRISQIGPEPSIIHSPMNHGKEKRKETLWKKERGEQSYC